MGWLPPGPPFFNDTASTEIYTLTLHDALPIFFITVNANDGSATAPGDYNDVVNQVLTFVVGGAHA